MLAHKYFAVIVQNIIYSRLSRDSTARGLFLGYPKEVPLRFKAGESFLFTEGYLKVENKEHLYDFIVTLYSIIFQYVNAFSACYIICSDIRLPSAISSKIVGVPFYFLSISIHFTNRLIICQTIFEN